MNRRELLKRAAALACLAVVGRLPAPEVSDPYADWAFGRSAAHPYRAGELVYDAASRRIFRATSDGFWVAGPHGPEVLP